ncbi:cell division protein FtsW [Halobacteriovorax sp. BALOs_7]|uniref:Probable peptidoglycan glycosyltransferase FtsW n=1 Tax=Halobacteriovorax vibrionivorans TaxID=2152716 RepID=A0ABY0IPN4_9BACT|nr:MULTISPECIES: putative lipid II flippase FtsW [Halobacteriovorax]AYF43116.1 cell division protein FtsW [Halobacteriovorax sp. BALOs_7]RZF23137.1 putative lipid II flippase FtsW [Halobacteriovorax vibrionivorans]TGD49231.1 putative lipid II flippase FtsW [Halobacteriovorax sp. Y22]
MNSLENTDRFGKFFLIITSIIVAFGVVMVYSSSYMFSKEVYGTSLHFFSRQIFFALFGIGLAFIVSKTKYQFWYKFSFHLNIVIGFLLILTFIPGLGVIAKGANRWINIGVGSLQPGEFAKYSTLMLSLFFFESYEKLDLKNRLKFAANIFFVLLLLILQPDFGTFFICALGIGFTCFISNFNRKYFYILASVGTVLSGLILIAQPYRVKRLMAFLDPWANPRGSGFQVIQSWIGFANGGFFGKGIGNSLEKLFFLPEAHNDFIFSVIGEEFGFLGVIAFVGLFMAFTHFGFRLALSLKDVIARKMVTSIVFIICVQACLNMGVVLGLLPTKGLNLPFVSYGGSSLLSNLIAIGVIFSCVSRQHTDNAQKPFFSQQ